MTQAKASIGEYFKFYNAERKHQTLGMVPDQMYFEGSAVLEAA
jgi:hypothetical protein